MATHGPWSYIYELIEDHKGFTFRCSDANGDDEMFEGFGDTKAEAVREASWESLRKALES